MSNSTYQEAEDLLNRAAALPVRQQRDYVDEFAKSAEVRIEAHKLLDLRMAARKRPDREYEDQSHQRPNLPDTEAVTLIDTVAARDQAAMDSPGIDQLPRHQYQRQRVLGRGGMGAVYEVWDPAVQRNLAMKVLHGQHADPATGRVSVPVARFLKEAQITGQIDHPGVAPVHEIASDDDGQLFFTMQVVVGKSLKEILALSADEREKDGWTQTRLLSIVLKVCDTLAYAHSKGIIHRDLKPSNIMVGQFGETYVMDWGLAKRIADDQADNFPDIEEVVGVGPGLAELQDHDPRIDTVDLTLDGSIMGTPMYMPPEQAAGEIEELGSAGDIYAIGAILYHILAGIPPYSDNGSKSAVEIVGRVCAGSPTALENISAKTSPELIAVCEKAMAREQDARYTDMVSMGDDLRAYLEHRVVKAYRTGAVVELKKWVARNRGVAAAITVAVTITLAGLGTISWVKSRHNDELSEKNIKLAAAKDKTMVALEQESLALRNARSLVLAGKSSQALDLDPTTALLLACEAAGLDSNASANTAILRALEESRELGVFPGYDHQNLQAPVLSADGMLIASAAPRPNFDVTIFDVRSGRRQAIYLGHTGPVRHLGFSPRGTFGLSISGDGTTAVWNTTNGRFQNATRYKNKNLIGKRAIFSPVDGEDHIISAGTADGKIYKWRWRDSSEDQPPELPKHQEVVLSIAYSPDGKRALTGSADGMAHLVDLETNEVMAEMTGHLGGVSHVEFAPEGGAMLTIATKKLITGNRLVSTESACYLWGRNGEPRYRLVDPTRDAPEDLVLSATFNSNGTEIVTGSRGGMLCVWEVKSGKLKKTIKGSDSPILSVDINRHHDRIVSTDGNVVRVWEWQTTGRSLVAAGALKGHDAPVTSVQFDHTGEHVITGAEDNTARYWRVRERSPLWIINPDYSESPAGTARFDQNGESVLISSKDGSKVTVWNVSDKSSSDLPIPSPVTLAIHAPDGQRIFTLNKDHVGHLYTRGSDRSWSRDPIDYPLGFEVDKARISGDYLLVTAYKHPKKGRAERWNLGNGTVDRRIDFGDSHENFIFTASFAAGGTRLIESCHFGMKLWNVDQEDADRTNPMLEEDPLLGGGFHSIPGGETFVTWPHPTPDGDVLRLWDLNSGKLRAELGGNQKKIRGANISADGKWVVTSGEDGLAKLWRVSDGTLVRTFTGHRGPLAPSWISGDGRYVLTRCTSSVDRTTRLWNTAAGGEGVTLGLNEKIVSDAEFSRTGQFVATVFRNDSEVAIWRTGSGELLTSLPGREGPIKSATFSPDDKWVLTFSTSGAVRLWPVDVLKFASNHLPRTLTVSERELYSVGSPEERSKRTSRHILGEELEMLELLEQALDGAAGHYLGDRLEIRYRKSVKLIVAELLKLEPAETGDERRVLLASLDTLGKEDAEAHSMIGRLQAAVKDLSGARKTIGRGRSLAPPDSDLATDLDEFYKSLRDN